MHARDSDECRENLSRRGRKLRHTQSLSLVVGRGEVEHAVGEVALVQEKLGLHSFAKG